MTSTQPHRPSRDQDERRIKSAAHMWRVSLDDAALSAAEQREFDAWYAADPRHRLAFDRAEVIWGAASHLTVAQLGYEPADVPTPMVWSALFAKLRRPMVPIGAAAALAMVSMFALWLGPTDQHNKAAAVAQARYQTAIGEITQYQLADGSTLTLGAASEVTVDFRPLQRSLMLTRGEAYFEVAKDEGRPFIVAAGDLRAQALGTQFDVKRTPTTFSVSVEEGTVAVSYPMTIDGTQLGTRSTATLEAGTMVISSLMQGLQAPRKVDQVASWRQKRLVYKSAPLSTVLDDITRLSGLQIDIDDTKILELKLTAAIDGTDIRHVFYTLERTFPLQVDLVENTSATLRFRASATQ